jgi:hypothetical protein
MRVTSITIPAMRLAILIIAVLLLLAGGLWLAQPRPAACPQGTHADPDRRARLDQRLRSALPRLASPDALALGQAHDFGTWCFGQQSELQENGPLLLDESLGDDEAAARAGHLLLHMLLPPWPDSQAPCEERVAQALEAEAHALSLELELRQVLGVTAPKVSYAFAAEHQQSPPDQRIPLIEKALRQHPNGAPGIPGLASAYAQRCHKTAP